MESSFCHKLHVNDAAVACVAAWLNQTSVPRGKPNHVADR